MSETRLKPCPFCGGEAEVNLFLGNHCVTCNHCMGAIFPGKGMTREEAIGYWNTRKPMERIVERLEELEEECAYPDDDEYTEGHYSAYKDALKIVKEEGGFDV